EYTDTSNPIFQLAAQFVNQTGRHIFLTGKAGTGKTTFLKYIRENSFKKMAIVAPTGVAAINAGGVTMHSFFQLPFGPFIPIAERRWSDPGYGWSDDNSGFTDPHSLFKNIRFSADKREILQELELLVIDEVSMVRADMLDAVDTILRHFRQQPLIPFGGVQVLYIGDLFQLPPVVSREEWALLEQHYKSPFFFDALALHQAPPIYLELEKIYRQSEATFINILNNIRNNRATSADLERLHDHYHPGLHPSERENYITLTSHNARADSINQQELNKLPGKVHSFEAAVTGEFQDRSFPAERTLQLKEGAQIMLIKNDKGEARRFFNGKIGAIKKIAEGKIMVTFPGELDELTLEKETWKNIRYNYNREKDQLEEEELGTFSQYPIRLAWAITIHKSQGLTFEKAIIDAGASFAPGQVYVALSRLTTIEGLILLSPIHPSAISTDPRVIGFTESRIGNKALQIELQQEQISFIRQLLMRAFNWSRLVEGLQDNFEQFEHKQTPDKKNAGQLMKPWLDKALAQQETAVKFSRQLDQLLASPAEDETFGQLQHRIQAASAYFIKALDEELIDPLQRHIGDMRIRQRAKKYLETLAELKMVFTRKKQQLEQAVQIVPGLKKNMDRGSLLSILQQQKKANADAHMQAGQAGTEGGSAPGGTPATAKGKAPKGETHRISLGLFREGVPVAEIAARRGMAMTTIEGHLASFILSGEIDIRELVPEHKKDKILSAIRELGASSVNPIKARLGDACSFGEIRAVLNYQVRLAQQNPVPKPD
ncbi:MAG TPA: helix-turn-helix domain-containing protein, partial [Puia sp.]|nr:helix-turn-helix domain-containing protein [Puia sp.]